MYSPDNGLKTTTFSFIIIIFIARRRFLVDPEKNIFKATAGSVTELTKERDHA